MSKTNKEKQLEKSGELEIDNNVARKQNQFETYVPFVVLGIAALILGVGLVYAINYAKLESGVTKNVSSPTVTENNVLNEESTEKVGMGNEEKKIDELVNDIDKNIQNLDPEESFSDFDTAEFGY